MKKPSAAQIIAGTGISRTHAYDILGGRTAPSLPLSLAIYRATGWRSGPIDGLTPQTIADLVANQSSAKAA